MFPLTLVPLCRSQPQPSSRFLSTFLLLLLKKCVANENDPIIFYQSVDLRLLNC